MPRLSIHIVTWNSRPYLENALRSLDEQTFKNFSVLIVDNASTDDTVKWLKENYPQYKIVQNTRNLGFAKGHNQAISFTKSDYVLVMNPDVILAGGYLEKLINILKKEKLVGSMVGKVYKLASQPDVLEQDSFTRIFDTTGLKADKSRRIINRGEGKEDHGQYDKERNIFGVSGNLALYRRQALDDIKYPPLTKGGRRRGEYFDEQFHSYKEDIDLAWRLQLEGWQSMFVPKAIAYHHRAVSGPAEHDNIDVAKNRASKPKYAHKVSYRNHLWMLVKNEQNFWRHGPWIIWYELKKFFYILLFEQKTLLGLWEFFRLLTIMREKRRIIQSQAKVSARVMRKWFS